MLKFEDFKKKIYENNSACEKAEESISHSSVKFVSESRLIQSIEKNHSIKITNSLVESYTNILNEDTFVVDPVVLEVKDYDNLGKFSFKLKDGASVSLSEDTYVELCKLLSNKYEVVEFMRESVDNFKQVLKKIRE